MRRLPFPHRIFKSIHPLIICSSFIFFAFTLKSISKLVLTEWPTFCSVAHIIIAAINPTPRTAVIFFVANFTSDCRVTWCAHRFTLKTMFCISEWFRVRTWYFYWPQHWQEREKYPKYCNLHTCNMFPYILEVSHRFHDMQIDSVANALCLNFNFGEDSLAPPLYWAYLQ